MENMKIKGCSCNLIKLILKKDGQPMSHSLLAFAVDSLYRYRLKLWQSRKHYNKQLFLMLKLNIHVLQVISPEKFDSLKSIYKPRLTKYFGLVWF